uniref:NTPase KAP family P-loop domain-containing protein 1 n=1 Tax=Monopterus albus TaxID=43700 RepID=UPI0009B3F1A1|nr:NTPase KAP family P-loop domain-containing protein 1 [Monopterus albus]
MILGQIEGYMMQEAMRIEQEYKGKTRPRSVQPSFIGFLTLIGRLLFYRPIWTVENQQHHNIRFIHVHFSAWHFAGSDLLWAGLAIRLFQSMQVNFGKLQLALYRVAQHDEEEEIKKKPEVKPGEEVTETKGQVGVLEGLAIAALGVPAASALRFAFLMVKNLIFNQDMNVKKGMDNEKISSQLGFMNEVRKEMWFLSRFIKFMEVFERRRIRVVLKITNLDRCSPKKIVAVLDAINILLSDEESQFISILAVNPHVLVEKVNFAEGCFSRQDRGYALLNRIVTLAFTIPPLCNDLKHSLFYSLTSNSKILEDERIIEDQHRAGCLKQTFSSDVSSVEMEDSFPLLNKTTEALDVKDEEVEKLVMSILLSNKSSLNDYMLDDAMFMRRVINSIRITVIIMKALKKELPQPEYIAAWVVLVTQWPCRLSWIIQCVEDAQQRAVIDRKNVTNTAELWTLWEVFSKSRAELYMMRAQIENLLEQDGDPEMFEKFLKVDFQFTVKDLKSFEEATVSLDHSIRKELAQIRGSSRLKDSGWMKKLAPLPITTLINMDTEDVCKELEMMAFPSKYIDIVKNNNLNGSALIFGNAEDLKDLLCMTFGEWLI